MTSQAIDGRRHRGRARWWLAAWLLCLATVLAGLAPTARAQAITIRDDRGTEHRLAAPAQRIVSLLPSLTESVAVLGGSTRLVGVDRWSNWPADAVARLPRLGGLDDVAIEAIVALRPDVVLASTASRGLDRLEAVGVRVLRLKSESHADVRRTLGLLAQLLGRPAEGERTWAAIERETAAAAARVPPALRGLRVYFELGGGPYAAGAGSFIGETLARLGLGNIVPPDMGPFPKLNPEFVLRARPDIVMGAERDNAALAARPGWASLPALQQQRLCGFASATYEMLVRPGPRLGEAAGVLADCLARLPLAAPARDAGPAGGAR